jgi:transposase
MTIVGALGLDGIRAAMSFEGAMNGRVFRVFIGKVLAPTLKAGDVVVMDNLSAHKVKGIKETIERRGAKVLYLPPYSPDFNPIEQCWSKVKTLLRKAKARTVDALNEAIDQAIDRVTGADAIGWFQHCGYSLNPT